MPELKKMVKKTDCSKLLLSTIFASLCCRGRTKTAIQKKKKAQGGRFHFLARGVSPDRSERSNSVTITKKKEKRKEKSRSDNHTQTALCSLVKGRRLDQALGGASQTEDLPPHPGIDRRRDDMRVLSEFCRARKVCTSINS